MLSIVTPMANHSLQDEKNTYKEQNNILKDQQSL